MLARVLPIFAMLGFGVLAGWLNVFPQAREAIATLNRFVLYIAAPLLIFGSLADPDLQMPADPGFYLIHVVSFVVVLVLVRGAMVVKGIRAHGGTLALCTAYGNITYLGIPFCARAFGDETLGLAALSSGLHSALAMTIGPILFLRWNRSEGADLGAGEIARRLVRQPLVWAPVFGLIVRFFNDSVQAVAFDYSMVIGVSAGPVAIFMLGLYVWDRRVELARIRFAPIAVNVFKLLVYPAVTFAVIILFVHRYDISRDMMLVAAAQSAMPVAVTTFSLAEEFELDRETVASAAILSSVVALVTLPLIAEAAVRLFG